MTTPQIFVTGSDGKVPVHEPNRRWTIWNYDEMYAIQFSDGSGGVLPGPGEKRYIPNIKDLVVSVDLWKWWQIIGVDISTGVATAREINPPKDPGNLSEWDILLGVGPGTQSDTYRVYLDKSVMPHTLAVDARLTVKGSMVSYCKIFRGADIGPNGKVISSFYDQSGNLMGQNVPLEIAARNDVENYTIKVVQTCYTTEDMPDGEVVTAVFYADDGHVVSTRQLLVKNTAFIRSTDSATKYITGISLKSPWLSQSDPRMIRYPINVPLRSMPIMGIVHYSNGDPVEMAIDGNKFKLHGLDNYAATIVGQEVPLVLTYRLSPDEINYGGTVGEGMHISEQYRAQTVKADGSYTLKLFGYPVWIDEISGYRLDWFLYNLDRRNVYRVTPWVKFAENSRPFDPIGYGLNQRFTVYINLRDVNSLFEPYNFVQTMEVVLVAPGNQRTTNWTIAFDPGQNPPYGRDLFADAKFINYNLWKVKVDVGAGSKEDWLNKLYYRTKPLTDPSKEPSPPEPNFFALVFGNNRAEFPISQWNSELTVGNGMVNNGTLFVEFFKRTPDNDIQLAMAAMPIYQST